MESKIDNDFSLLPHSPNRPVLFENRADALQKLLEYLAGQYNLKISKSKAESKDYIVLAISFAGVFFASNLSKAIGVPLDFIFTAPIVAPNNEECVIAMVSETRDIVIHEALANSFEISLDYIYGEAQRQYEETILPNIYKYRKGSVLTTLNNQKVLLVDDGIGSGLTLATCVKSVREHLKAQMVSIIAPVAPFYVVENLENLVDSIYCLYRLKDFVDVEYYYRDYPKISNEEIEKILNEHYKEKEG